MRPLFVFMILSSCAKSRPPSDLQTSVLMEGRDAGRCFKTEEDVAECDIDGELTTTGHCTLVCRDGTLCLTNPSECSKHQPPLLTPPLGLDNATKGP